MRLLKIILFFLLPVIATAQVNPLYLEPNKQQADSLRQALTQDINDTLRMAANRELALYYLDVNTDSALFYIEKDLPLARKLKLKLWEADALDLLGIICGNKGNYVRSIKSVQEALQIVENRDCEKNIWQISKFTYTNDPGLARLSMLSTIYSDVAGLYANTGHYEKQLNAIRESLKIAERINDPTLLSQAYRSLGSKYYREGKLDSALANYRRSLFYSGKAGYYKYSSNNYNRIGRIYLVQNDFPQAFENLTKGLQSAFEQNNNPAISQGYIGLAAYYKMTRNNDSALYYAKLGMTTALKTAQIADIIRSYDALADIYKSLNRPDSALVYLELSNAANDSLLSLEKIKQVESIGFDEQLRLQELEKEKLQTNSRIRTYSLLGGLGVLLIIAGLLYRNNRQKHRTNRALETTLARLKNTQAQLVQSEKMASLGELTAGIAHEIQNPLNFVNNFSEVNEELLAELQEEMTKGNTTAAMNLAKAVSENQQKINHHGKRAEAIVKGMLQHSRNSSGQKELTDINNLVDECMRLSYHGMRAKDKSFNANMETSFDASLQPVSIVSQDIGRVLLNLFTNSFYAVMQKKTDAGEGYDPIVSVTTQKLGNKIRITVRDNGNGIPSKVIDKIFQPFFTTKPTGQGTGLGLSMSYDIISKGHGGELVVDTKEGEFAEFTITLPV